ncbi:MAG TPA: hypothetical protein VF607_08645, partial [Verrucomicrobiae bacterium]
VTVNTVVPNGPTNAEAITFAGAGSSLSLSWPTTGWRLQVQTNTLTIGLGTNWVDWPGATTTNQVVLPISGQNPGVFFRLVYP